MLQEAGLNPSQVRLLRHQTTLAHGRSLLDAWRTDRPAFEQYQSLQLRSKRASFARAYWAAFFGTWDGRTVFGGIYEVGTLVPLEEPSTNENDRKSPASYWKVTNSIECFELS